MATFRFFRFDATTGADTITYLTNWITYLGSNNTLASADRMRGSPGAGEVAVLTGEKLNYISNPFVGITGGRIEGGTLSHLGNQILSVTDIGISGKAWGESLFAGPTGVLLLLISGNDRMFGSTLADNLAGGRGSDTIRGGNGGDTLSGAGLLMDDRGNDRLFGEAGNDTLTGGFQDDQLFGGAGDDVLFSFDGRDLFFGGAGNDVMTSPIGSGNFVAGSGNDIGAGGNLRDRFSGGGGNDVFTGMGGADTGTGGIGNDQLVGDMGDDLLSGDAGADSVIGGAGDDRCFGGSGSDQVTGVDGNDILKGGLGVDSLTGGLGIDQFVFDTKPTAGNADLVADFAINIDKIIFDNDIYTALGAAGGLGVAKFRVGANAADASDRIIYDSGTGALYYDRDGNGGAGKVLVATLAAGLALDAGDFVVIG